MTPCDVLARVTHAGQEVAGLELRRARRLVAAGCPVGVVEPRVDPLVYVHGGFAVTLWVYSDNSATPPVSAKDYAKALAVARRHAHGRPG